MAIVGGVATLLAAMPLASVFLSWTWMMYAAVAITVVIGAATLARVMHAPAGIQVLAMLAGLLLILTLMFPSGREIARVIPTNDTFANFNRLFELSGHQIRTSAVPVPDLDGLLLLATTGIGLVAIVIDLVAVGIRRPALAGLPMLAMYSVPVAVLPGGVSFIYFALACAGYLWLLVSDSVDRVRRFGRRFSGEGRDVDIWEPSPLSSAGRRLGVVVIVLAILLPLAVPGMTSTLVQKFADGGGGGQLPGGGAGGDQPVTTVDMNALLKQDLTLNETFEMVKLHTNDPSPYYLRLGMADQVDGSGFHTQTPTGGGLQVDQAMPTRVPTGPVAGTYQAQIQITGLSLSLAPVYSRVTGVQGLDNNWFLDENSDEVYSLHRNINGATYTIEYARLTYSPDQLRQARSVLANDPAIRPGLTDVPQSAYVANLVNGLVAGQTTEYDQVLALYDYFSTNNGFRYSLSTVDGQSGSAIVDFLQNKRGFCVQYAAALAWLVRQAGYPARVAFGFTRGTGSRDNNYSLTNLNLHAWTEVYFPGDGWVPFDATPGGFVPGSTRTEWAPDVEKPSQTPGASPTEQASLEPGPPKNGGTNGDNTTTGSSGPALHIKTWYVVVAGIVVAVVLMLLAPALQRRSTRRRRRAQMGPVIALTPAPPGQEDVVTDPASMTAAQRDAHNAWAELLDTMIDYGVLVDPAETPRGTAGRLATTPALSPTGRPPTALIARAEERARYAPSPVRATNLDQAVRAARAAFADNATRWQRFSAWLFPRSVLMRWRLGWYGLVARTARQISGMRDVLLLVPLRERRRGR
jgi:transglutaminase-like putative cysteine protease